MMNGSGRPGSKASSVASSAGFFGEHQSAGRPAGVAVLVVEPDDQPQLPARLDPGQEGLPVLLALHVVLERDVANHAAQSPVGVESHSVGHDALGVGLPEHLVDPFRHRPARIDPMHDLERPIFRGQLVPPGEPFGREGLTGGRLTRFRCDRNGSGDDQNEHFQDCPTHAFHQVLPHLENRSLASGGGPSIEEPPLLVVSLSRRREAGQRSEGSRPPRVPKSGICQDVRLQMPSIQVILISIQVIMQSILDIS